MPRCASCSESIAGSWRNIHGQPHCANCISQWFVNCSVCGLEIYRYDARHTNGSEDSYCYECYHDHCRWQPGDFDTSTISTKRTGSPRCFGIELETSRCTEYMDLRDQTVFGVKEDGSIDGLEFVSPILAGDQGLAEIEKFCDLAAEKGFEVNEDCGYHLHIDMRDTTDLQRRHIAYAYRLTYELWASLVKKDRRNNTFCYKPCYRASDIRDTEDFGSFIRHLDRYQFINLRAYRDHTTYELRGYQGTLSKTEICNWIAAHLRFVEFVKDKSFAEIDTLFDCESAWTNLRRVLGARLARYYARLRTQLV